ncbi:PREDICTED: olfactory receptor 14A16-like [Thamnophis sirtalis]|uniref:Olfactory receptor n=1 Tax=Thamnophis sirtalis TaxID=35019 RepID=A0A6I9XU17_9SAUR|nr:PREDICTED: olfactory receptor 14A16-like [Thamnophis sirtalis]
MFQNTSVSTFLLLEFSKTWELQILHFTVFLLLYLTIVTGNLLIISAVAFDHHLHTPLYFFLMNLAIQDLCSISVILPKSMVNSLLNTRDISYFGCVAQVLFFFFFISSDFFLLTVMAYDRYIAICNPLHYVMVMNKQACTQMVATVWLAGLAYGVLHTSGTFVIPFCSNVVNQFFCEIPQLLKLACSDLYLIEIGVVVVSVAIGVGCCCFIIVTYVHIFMTLLRIPSMQGRKKAFETCLPHIIVFSMFLFTGSIAYLRPISDTPSYLDLIFTIIYSMLPPLLNPIIYSMRNKAIKKALSKLFRVKHCFLNTLSRLD